MKRFFLPLLVTLFTIHSQAQSPMDIEQLYGAPGGGYIIFTDWGADYPLPGIQEYHKWSDLHLVDTFAIFGDSVCISLFMDSVAMNCVVIPGIEGICLDTFYINPGDSLVLVECDNDTTFFAGGGGPDLNGHFSAGNEGGQIAITTAILDDGGLYYSNGLNTSYYGYEPVDGRVYNYSDQTDPMLVLSNSTGAPVMSFEGGNTVNVGVVGSGDFNITDGAVSPFTIQTGTTVTNSIRVEADGDVVFADYPNSRDDGTPTNFTGTDGSGTLQSYPVADMPENQNLTVEGSGPTYDIAISEGTDVTIAGAGGITLSEGTPNVLTITQTADGDGSATNEIQVLSGSGAGPFAVDLSLSGGTIGLIEGTNIDITRSGNDFTFNSTAGGFTNWLLAASGTGGTEAVTDGETVTIAAGTGITATRSTNTVTIASTVVDTDDQGLTITGAASPFTIDIDNGSDVSIASGANVTLTESPANQLNIAVADEAIQDVAGAMFTGNTETGITVTYQDADGTIDLVAADDSATNEAWTIDADDADTEVISNQTVRFEGLGGITTNYIPLTNTLEIELTGGGGDGNGMWTSSNDNTNIANSAFEVGVPGYLDFRDGSEHDLYIDAANDRIGMGTNGPSYGLHVRNDAGMAVESFSDDVAMVFKVEGTAEGTGADTTMASILMSYTDSDHAGGVEQTAVNMSVYKYSDTGQRTAFKITLPENTDADAIVIEKEAALSGNHQESLVSLNGGFANTQNYEWTATGADLTIDRGYFGVIVSGSGAIGDEILLPNIFHNGDSWESAMTATDCQVGQEYYITNLRASTALIVRTNSGDFFRASATTVSIPAGFSLHIRATRLNGTTGIWASWLSD